MSELLQVEKENERSEIVQVNIVLDSRVGQWVAKL